MTKRPARCPGRSYRYLLRAIIAASWLATPTNGFSEPAGCKLVTDERNPTETILRCGNDLTVGNTPKTRYEMINHDGQVPGGARLDSGALMIEFTPRGAQKNFQILTPHAI